MSGGAPLQKAGREKIRRAGALAPAGRRQAGGQSERPGCPENEPQLGRGEHEGQVNRHQIGRSMCVCVSYACEGQGVGWHSGGQAAQALRGGAVRQRRTSAAYSIQHCATGARETRGQQGAKGTEEGIEYVETYMQRRNSSTPALREVALIGELVGEGIKCCQGGYFCLTGTRGRGAGDGRPATPRGATKVLRRATAR